MGVRAAEELVVVLGNRQAVVATAVAGDIYIPFAGIIIAWTMVADASGSITVDTWKAAYPTIPTVSNTMWGTKPNLSSQQVNQATGLSITVNAGDIIRYNVDSATTVKQVTLSFTILRTA